MPDVSPTFLFVGNLPFTVSSDDVTALLAANDVEGANDVHVQMRGERALGFAYVAFDTAAAVDAAVTALKDAQCGERTVAVELAKSKPGERRRRRRKGGGGGGSTAEGDGDKSTRRRPVAERPPLEPHSAFVAKLPRDLDDVKLHALFVEFGCTSARVVVRRVGSTSRGFGFVAFDSDASRTAAIAAMNEKNIEGHVIAVVVARDAVAAVVVE